MRISDWSSDVCSSDLEEAGAEVTLQIADDAHLLRAHRFGLEQVADPLRLASDKAARGRMHEFQSLNAVGIQIGIGPNQGNLGGRLSRRVQPVGELPVVNDLGEASAPDIVGKRSEEHTYELQSLMRISYAVFSLKKKIQ